MTDRGETYAIEAAAKVAQEVPLATLAPHFDKARICLTDFYSCAFEAAGLPWSQQAEAVAEPSPTGATIIGAAKRAVPGDAAFANAVRGHGLVREDMHSGSIAHLGIVVWPALLAAAQEHRISGEDFLAGAVVGYEMGGRLGRALVTPEVARLFRPTGLVGPVAAAAAVARALRLPVDVTASALSLAANTAGGMNQWPHHGADEMYFHPGFAVRNALTSVRLAQAGAWGSPAILEGESGLLAAFARVTDGAALELFPTKVEAEIATVFNKDVPACNFAQSPAQTALAALQKAGKPASEIGEVRLETYDAALNYPGCASLGPFGTPLAAKMSIAFGVAAALDAGEIAETNYQKLDDAAIKRLIGAMRFDVSPELNAAFPGKQGARVTLRFLDGSETACAHDDIHFATPELIVSRFNRHGRDLLGQDRAEQLGKAIEMLASLDDAARVASLGGLETST